MRVHGQVRHGSTRWLGLGPALLTAAIVVAGCSQGSGTQVTTTGKPLTAAALAAAATKTDTAGSARFHFTMAMSGASLGNGISMSGDGAFDPTTHRSEGDVDMSSFMSQLGALGSSAAGSGKMHEITDGTTEYVQWSLFDSALPAGKTWAKIDLSGMATSSEMNSMTADASSYLKLLEGISGNVTRVGSEQIGGQSTVHYRAQIDIAKMLDRLPKNLPSDVSSVFKKMGSGSFPVDVWVGDDGFVHQLAMKMDLGQLSAQAIPVSMSLTETLSGFGQPVTITLPPADQVAPMIGLNPLPALTRGRDRARTHLSGGLRRRLTSVRRGCGGARGGT